MSTAQRINIFRGFSKMESRAWHNLRSAMDSVEQGIAEPTTIEEAYQAWMSLIAATVDAVSAI